MKLFQTYLSPFPTRVRLMLCAKGIDCEIVEPPGFHGDTRSKGSYLEVNPIGRVPALMLDDGRVLPESEVICEYLEDAFPEPRLMPSDPWRRAQVRLLSRLSDFYIVMAMLPLFLAVERPPERWDQEAIRRDVGAVGKTLDQLEIFIGTNGYAVGHSLTHADGTLVPILQLATEWMPIFRGPDMFAGRPKIAAYWTAIARDPICARLTGETRQALRKSMGKGWNRLGRREDGPRQRQGRQRRTRLATREVRPVVCFVIV
jgi:glutathione S-transferase